MSRQQPHDDAASLGNVLACIAIVLFILGGILL